MKISHIKYLPFSIPFFYKKAIVNNKDIEWQVKFSENSIYDLNGNDQYDWNKLCGVKWDYFTPRENAIMCGWRYNIELKSFQLCLYFHKDGSVDTSNRPLIDVPIGTTATISMKFYTNQKLMLFSVYTNEFDQLNVKLDWDLFDDGYYINSWFGGNKTPNKLITFDLKQTK